MQDLQSCDSLWCAEKSQPRCQDLPGIQGVITMSIYVLCFGRLNPCTWVNVLDHAFASSSVTCKGQHPRRELYGHGNVLFRCSFQDAIDLYRSSDLHIVCIYSIYGCSGVLIFFWIFLDISKHPQPKTDPGEQLQRAAAVFPIRTLGKAAAVSFLGSQVAFRGWVGPGTWKRHEVSWWVKDDERFVMDENRWTIN